MTLSSLHLDAFHAVARTLNFSRAAKELRITQSALTQRIQNLEDELGLTLFVRSPRGAQTTPAGDRLLRYCQARGMLEEELLDELKGEASGSGLGGSLRLAGYSTVMRSLVIPALAPMLRANSRVLPHFLDLELRELGNALLRGEVDYIVIDQPVSRGDLAVVPLGEEENVLVTAKDFESPDDLYLDHDPEDKITFDFLALQGDDVGSIRRAYFDDIYGIIDGVALGLGRAVIPKHLADGDPRLKSVRGKKSLSTPVHLQFFKQPFYTKLHEKIVTELKSRLKL